MFLPGLNLTYTDRSTMAASTEVRVPFVDIEVVKAAFEIPGNRKIGSAGKIALKEAALGILPSGDRAPAEGPVQRPAARAWMSRDLAPLVREVVNIGRARHVRASCSATRCSAGRGGRVRSGGPVQAPLAHLDS